MQKAELVSATRLLPCAFLSRRLFRFHHGTLNQDGLIFRVKAALTYVDHKRESLGAPRNESRCNGTVELRQIDDCFWRELRQVIAGDSERTKERGDSNYECSIICRFGQQIVLRPTTPSVDVVAADQFPSRRVEHLPRIVINQTGVVGYPTSAGQCVVPLCRQCSAAGIHCDLNE